MAHKKLNKRDVQGLQKRLQTKREHGWHSLSDKDRQECQGYSSEYSLFLSKAKTEREVARGLSNSLSQNGFTEGVPKKVGPFFKVYRQKALYAFRPGKLSVTKGLRIIVTHIDTPRLDLKPNPLYEDLEMAFLKTHYYGGIKKFQWLTRPLAIHGVLFLKDGQRVDLSIGEEDHDPVFTINDLLPHLAAKVQGDKKLREAVAGESLNVLFGGLPINGPKDTKEAVKLGCLHLLNQRFGITERDLVSAEIEVVPQGSAREVGIDAAFIGGYGQDDRASAFAALKAILSANAPERPCLALFLDKEEIGSDGNTGAKSRLLELAVYDALRMEGTRVEPDTLLRVLDASVAISGDVTAGIEPNYPEVHEKRNNPLIGHGVNLTKYTGARGKYSANDAHAELVNWLTRLWDEHHVKWQAGELGKVDEGGGGTVAKYVANLGVDTVDAGPPLLSMHSPFEIAHKFDLFSTYRAYKVFFEAQA